MQNTTIIIILVLVSATIARAGDPTTQGWIWAKDPSTRPSWERTTELFSQKTSSEILKIYSVETQHDADFPTTDPVLRHASVYQRSFRITKSPLRPVHENLNEQEICVAGGFGDLIVWDEPRWLAVAFDGTHMAVLYNQYGCCRALMFSKHSGEHFEADFPEFWYAAKNGSICAAVDEGQISVDTAGAAMISVLLPGSGRCEFKSTIDHGDFHWIQASGGHQPEMPRYKLPEARTSKNAIPGATTRP